MEFKSLRFKGIGNSGRFRVIESSGSVKVGVGRSGTFLKLKISENTLKTLCVSKTPGAEI